MSARGLEMLVQGVVGIVIKEVLRMGTLGSQGVWAEGSESN